MSHAQQLVAAVSIAACWGACVLVWVAWTLYGISRGPAPGTRPRLRPFAITVVIVVVVVLAIVRSVPAHSWQALQVHLPWATGIGLVILVGATVFTLWARFALGTMWSMDAEVKSGHALHTDGPYGITRHPIYTGLLGMLLGSVLLLGAGRYLLLLPVGVGFLEVKLHTEEQLLLAAFPVDYPRYRQRVPQLIPGLRLRRTRAERTRRAPEPGPPPAR